MSSRDPRIEGWEDQAAFMRRAGATHATWDPNGRLVALVLAPAPVERPPGPAARMAGFHATAATAAQRRHETMFAASSIKPPFEPPPTPPSAVPRAVRAKEEAARRGEAKRGR